MFLIVNNMVNIQQNNDLLSLCKRADLHHYEISCINEDDQPEFYIGDQKISNVLKNKSEYFFMTGSYNLAVKLKQEGFLYGHNIENLSYEKQIEKWYKALFLNGDAEILKTEDLKKFNGEMFFRSVSDSKAFQAGVYTYKELIEINCKETLLMSSVKQINAEYRFFIVNKKIADNSSYKIGKMFDIQRKAPPEMVEFVMGLLEEWCPTENFVLDVADKNGTSKIIEVNNIHCARSYGCSLSKIIENSLNLKP